MVDKKNLTCWEISQCQRSEGCPAKEQPKRVCWEIAAELPDHRSAFNVCKDCLVYLTKMENSSLADEEITRILVSKGVCVLPSACPQYMSFDGSGR